MSAAPPRHNFLNIPIVHHIESVYKNIYRTSGFLTKRDKLGIQTQLLTILLATLEESIHAGLSNKKEKIFSLQKVRRNIEVAKHLLRIEYDLQIISPEFYIKTIQELQVISIMTNGWLKSVAEHPL